MARSSARSSARWPAGCLGPFRDLRQTQRVYVSPPVEMETHTPFGSRHASIADRVGAVGGLTAVWVKRWLISKAGTVTALPAVARLGPEHRSDQPSIFHSTSRIARTRQ